MCHCIYLQSPLQFSLLISYWCHVWCCPMIVSSCGHLVRVATFTRTCLCFTMSLRIAPTTWILVCNLWTACPLSKETRILICYFKYKLWTWLKKIKALYKASCYSVQPTVNTGLLPGKSESETVTSERSVMQFTCTDSLHPVSASVYVLPSNRPDSPEFFNVRFVNGTALEAGRWTVCCVKAHRTALCKQVAWKWNYKIHITLTHLPCWWNF